MTEDDCFLPPDYAITLLQVAAEQDAQIVGAPWITPADGETAASALARARRSAAAEIRLTTHPGVVPDRDLQTPFPQRRVRRAPHGADGGAVPDLAARQRLAGGDRSVPARDPARLAVRPEPADGVVSARPVGGRTGAASAPLRSVGVAQQLGLPEAPRGAPARARRDPSPGARPGQVRGHSRGVGVVRLCAGALGAAPEPEQAGAAGDTPRWRRCVAAAPR